MILINSICILLLFIIIHFLLNNKYKEHFNIKKPIIWMFWETIQGHKKPGYIDLCYQSVLHNCNDCFEIIYLDEEKIKKYLPELKNYQLDHLKIQHKADFYRYLLLDKYGGFWIDADILVLKCLCNYTKHLDKHDYIGFGCGFNNNVCSKTGYGYGSPLNWMMASKPNSKFLKCIISNAQDKIQNKNGFRYHDIGRETLRKCASELKEKYNWSYYHVPSTCNEYDEHGHKLNKIFKNYGESKCNKDRYFFPFYNTAPGYPQWFKDLNAEQIKKLDLPIQNIIQEAFSKRNKCK